MLPMSNNRLSAVRWTAHARALNVGDFVRTGENLYPHYEVVAVSGDRAWVRDVQFGTDQVVPVERCSRISKNSTLPPAAC